MNEDKIVEVITEAYNLKIGDYLPENVIKAWEAGSSNNRFDYGTNGGGRWHKTDGMFTGDRKIEGFKKLNGVIGFLVSGTYKVYLRAEGFKEFMKNEEKSKSAIPFISFTPKVGDWVQHNGELHKVPQIPLEVVKVENIQVHLGPPYNDWVNISWFNGAPPYFYKTLSYNTELGYQSRCLTGVETASPKAELEPDITNYRLKHQKPILHSRRVDKIKRIITI